MASKVHVDNTVNERRLRPIYDWLDIGKNKKALQEANKVLKKQPTNQCARVLKALALFRLGKEDECLEIMDKVQAEVPCEDSTLQAMSICYREIHQPDKISEVYEAAAKADPNNEEVLTHLFMSYVRLGDYKKQQQAALSLYKLKPKNPYYFWAVMSVVMQAIYAEEKLAKGVILPLAERMVLKLVNEGKIEAEQEVQLYLMILEMQGKNEEILKVLSSPLAVHLSSVVQRKAAVFLSLERFTEAADALKQLIKENVKNWEYYNHYLSAALKIQDPAECLNFFDEMTKISEKENRALYLAKLELLRRTGIEENDMFKPVNLMVKYFSNFGDKGCAVGDLKVYLNLLSTNGKDELIRKLEEEVGVTPDDHPADAKQMQKHINLEKIKRILGYHHPPMADLQQQEEIIKRLCSLYEKGNELFPVESRLPTDFCPADTYVILAAHILHQLWVETDEAKFLYGGMALLERALLSSPCNFHIKLLLVRLYLEAGLVGAAQHAYSLLDIKYIQLDSMGHLHTPLLAPLGHLTLASDMLDDTTQFFISNYKDSSDHLTFAYKYGSFIKIQEFVELRERLENSLHFAMTTVDKMILELTLCNSSTSLFLTLSNMHIQPSQDSVRWNLLRDNRDLEVIMGWEPLTENAKNQTMQEETRQCMMKLLLTKSFILRILAATAEESSDLLLDLSYQLKQVESEQIPPVLKTFEVEGNPLKSCNLLVPLDAVERLKESYYSQQLITIARFTEFLAKSQQSEPECVEMLKTTQCLQTPNIPDKENATSYKRFLLRVATCSETLAIITAMCTAFATKFEPQSTKKKNKKKLTAQIESISINDSQQAWVGVATVLEERLQKLLEVLTEFKKHKIQTGLDSVDPVSATIISQAQESLAYSCRSIKFRAEVTHKLLSSLLKS
ncbi:N-alpha-acetyltransferase 25, NatB auxiliary subunit [Prorops nasuta]|uniref:N-alpha-acetyltransferase 25, NatB auxiliary subunit n=1 Tax=Prorops nasuta TaxID=863751 RepID=UPI0034CF3670